MQEWGQCMAGWLRRGAAALLQSGPVPRHVAFIMDGNRRFADRLQLDRYGGHSRGYDKVNHFKTCTSAQPLCGALACQTFLAAHAIWFLHP